MTATARPADVRADPRPVAAVEPPAPTGGRAAVAATVARTRDRSGVGAPGALRAPRGHRRALPLGPRRVGLGEHVLLGRGAGRRRRAGRRSSSARPTRRTSSPSTRRPLSLWPMEISARIFGVNSWSILVPQALRASATVGVALRDGEALVRRRAPALVAGVVIALTPVAALMFRFNNPDALLALLLMTRRRLRDDPGARATAARAGSSSPASLVGFAFLAKELQAFLVLPGVRARVPHRRAAAARSAHVARDPARAQRRSSPAAGGSRSCQLWPASSRPYIGGSQNNSFWNVLFGYNGFGRLTGSETGSVGGGGPAGGRRAVGPDRLDPPVQRQRSAVRRRG